MLKRKAGFVHTHRRDAHVRSRIPAAFKIPTISVEQHLLRGLSSEHRASVQAPVAFRPSASVPAPASTAASIAAPLTLEQ